MFIDLFRYFLFDLVLEIYILHEYHDFYQDFNNHYCLVLYDICMSLNICPITLVITYLFPKHFVSAPSQSYSLSQFLSLSLLIDEPCQMFFSAF